MSLKLGFAYQLPQAPMSYIWGVVPGRVTRTRAMKM